MRIKSRVSEFGDDLAERWADALLEANPGRWEIEYGKPAVDQPGDVVADVAMSVVFGDRTVFTARGIKILRQGDNLVVDMIGIHISMVDTWKNRIIAKFDEGERRTVDEYKWAI